MQKTVEKYLAEVEKQLSSLPAELRASELRELRLHIEQLIKTFMADGQSEEDATTTALLQFGQAKQLCRGLKQAHSKPQWVWARSFLALLVAIVTEMGLYSAYYSLTVSYGFIQPSSWAYIWSYAQLYNGIFMFKTFFVLSGFVAGWVAEVIAPRLAIWSLIALCFLRVALVVANSQIVDYRTATFGAVLLVGYCGTRLRQWQLNRRQLAIVC